MPWIAAIPYDDADDRLRRLYDRVAGPGGHVDNIMAMHSLRPHTMEGHLSLYKNVLHVVRENQLVPATGRTTLLVGDQPLIIEAGCDRQPCHTFQHAT